ncbi:MAG: hypothetical protein M1838_002701 [Thelocarpon superellum]|nr:MAG: hypothetical protein M1838_002701 [Thelocarpon superellum]
MTDSSTIPKREGDGEREALDLKEQPILEQLLAVREQLFRLKQDKSTYIRASDIVPLYDQIIEQVHSLNEIRKEERQEQNRVDKVLDDCFQLISLFFLTIGRNNEAPAVYATTSTLKRLLDHLTEARLYCAKDLESITATLEDTKTIVKKGKDKYSPQLLTLLEARIDICEKILKDRDDDISGISPELAPIHEKMISILRSISAANTKQKFPPKEVKDLQAQLREIEDAKIDGHFVGPHVGKEAGQTLLAELLSRCLMWSETVLERQGKIDNGFQLTYDELRDVRNQLAKLTLTQAWSLRETDLYGFQRTLDKIDEARVEGNFLDAQGNQADLYHQRTLLYLIRRSYAYIYSLIVSSEPVSEALLPVYNQLQTLRRCLLEVKRSGGVSSPRELYPYSMKLNSIDNMRVDGRFVLGSEFPEGQGSVISLLEECFELSYELRVAAEGEEEAHKEDENPNGANGPKGAAEEKVGA